jgi:hypothetical protein
MRLGLGENCLDLGNRPMTMGELIHNPVDQLLQEFAFDRPAGFADGYLHGPQVANAVIEANIDGIDYRVGHLWPH